MVGVQTANVTALGLGNSLPHGWSNTHQQPIATCVNHGDTKWDTSATKSHGAVCTSSKLHSSCLLVSSYDSCLWEFGHQFFCFGSRSHLLILRFSSLLGTYIGKHPPPGSWSPAGTGPQKPLQGEAVLGSGTSAFARSLPLAWSWLPTGRIVPIRNVNHYKLEAFHESVSTALLPRCITKANFGAFSGGWQKAHPLHDSSSYWEMWRRKFPAKEKVTRICQHVWCLSSSQSQKEQGFQTHYSKKVSSPSWQLKTSQITRNWKWSFQNGEVLGGIEDLTDSLYFLLGRHIHVHSQSHTVLFIYLNFNYCWIT